MERHAVYLAEMIERNGCEEAIRIGPDPDSDMLLRRNKTINGPINHPTLKLNVYRKTETATVTRAHSDAVLPSKHHHGVVKHTSGLYSSTVWYWPGKLYR